MLDNRIGFSPSTEIGAERMNICRRLRIFHVRPCGRLAIIGGNPEMGHNNDRSVRQMGDAGSVFRPHRTVVGRLE